VDNLAEVLPSGDYVDSTTAPGQGGTGYVLTVTTSSAGFVGWLVFIYQDGRYGVILHYSATAQSSDTFRLVTDSGGGLYPYAASSGLYPFGQPTEERHIGDIPIPPAMAYSGTYASATVTLSNCVAYLYWVNEDPTQYSCTFTYDNMLTPSNH